MHSIRSPGRILQCESHRLTCFIVKQKTLSRYLIGEILPPFFFGLLAFTFILLVARMLRLVELLVTRGVSPLEVLQLFSLFLPTFLELTVPMAFLLAILLGLGRLAGDTEILAMKASGISPFQILWPVAIVAVGMSLLTLFITTTARPAANMALKKELYNVARSHVGTALKEKVFNDDFPNILIYVEEIVPPGNTAQGVLIVDRRENEREDIILSKVALIATDSETNTLALKLFDGSIYEKTKKRSAFSETRFNIYDFRVDLDELVGRIKRKDAGPKEMSLRRLIHAIGQKQAGGLAAIAERMELHQRFSFAFVPLIFSVLGVGLTLLPRSSKAGRSWGFTLCVFWLLIYYTLLSLGKALGEKGILPPVPALWLPNFVVGAIAAHLFTKALRESPLALQNRFDAGMAWGGRCIGRIRDMRLRRGD